MVNAWVQHVKNFASQHNIPYYEAIKQAKETYKKTMGGDVVDVVENEDEALASVVIEKKKSPLIQKGKYSTIIKKQFPEEFSNAMIPIIDGMTISKYPKIVGTFSTKGMLYPSDVDMFDTVKTSKKTEKQASAFYTKKLQQCVRDLLRLHGVIIADIKAGQDDKGQALRWRPFEILRGKKGKYYLKDCFYQPARIKMDTIAFISNVFVEFSMIYFFENNGKLTNDFPIPSIPEEIDSLKKKGKYFKAVKRMYILQKSPKFVKLFNSDAGMIYQVSGHLKTIEYLLENEKILLKERSLKGIDADIDSQLDEMITKLNMLMEKQLLTHQAQIDKLLRKAQSTTKHSTLLKYIKQLTGILDDISNAYAKDYMGF